MQSEPERSRRFRPSTDGCTEWSCTYHGKTNRERATVHQECVVFGDQVIHDDACKAPTESEAI